MLLVVMGCLLLLLLLVVQIWLLHCHRSPAVHLLRIRLHWHWTGADGSLLVCISKSPVGNLLLHRQLLLVLLL